VQHIGILEMIVLRSSMHGEDILEHTNAKCFLCALQSTCRPLCDVSIHLITLLNILMPRYQYTQSDAKCHEMTLMVKLMVVSIA